MFTGGSPSLAGGLIFEARPLGRGLASFFRELAGPAHRPLGGSGIASGEEAQAMPDEFGDWHGLEPGFPAGGVKQVGVDRGPDPRDVSWQGFSPRC